MAECGISTLRSHTRGDERQRPVAPSFTTNCRHQHRTILPTQFPAHKAQLVLDLVVDNSRFFRQRRCLHANYKGRVRRATALGHTTPSCCLREQLLCIWEAYA